MSLFGNSEGIAMWDVCTMVNHRHVQKTKERSLLISRKGEVEVWGGAALDKSPLEETGSGGFSVADRDNFSLAGTFSLLSKEKIFLLG